MSFYALFNLGRAAYKQLKKIIDGESRLIGEQSQIKGWFDEMFSGPSEWSAAGKQRTENIKAREHATAERLAAEAFNAAEAEKLREWQERLANTSYQRAVEDLQAAGINPILAAGTPGATTPVGASAKSAAAPAGANYTVRESLAGIAKVAGMVLMAVNTGARLAASSGQTLAKTAANTAAKTAANTAASYSSAMANAPDWLKRWQADLDAKIAASNAKYDHLDYKKLWEWAKKNLD
jgi:hypothetical protein